MTYRLKLIFSLTILLLTTFYLSASVKIEFSDKILKMQEFRFYPLDSKGFALYDDGEEHLKIFNWGFQETARIPLKKGEGPGEIKGKIAALCILNQKKMLLNLSFEKNIRVYDWNGKHIDTLPIKLPVRQFFNKGNRVIAINNNFDKESKTTFFAKILDNKTLAAVTDIRLKEKIEWPEEFSNADIYLDDKGYFATGKNNHIIMMLGSLDLLYEIDEHGNIISKMKLPHRSRVDKKTLIKNGKGEEITFTQYLHSYYDMNKAGDSIYICYYKCLRRKPGSPDKFQLYVLKILPDNSVKEKVFDQKLFYIIGGHNGMVYFFNADDYNVTGVHEKEWK